MCYTIITLLYLRCCMNIYIEYLFIYITSMMDDGSFYNQIINNIINNRGQKTRNNTNNTRFRRSTDCFFIVIL